MSLFLGCLLAVLLLMQVHSEGPSLLHVPFEPRDHITPSSLFERYPEMLVSLRPEVMAQRIANMPYLLKQMFRLTTVTVVNRQIAMRCYTSIGVCPYDR